MIATQVRRRPWTTAAALVLFAAAGCVRESNNQGERAFQYELWVPLCVLLAGLAAGVAGFFLRKHNTRVGWALLIIGPLAALGFAPSMFLDRAAVSKDGFDIRTGIWGQTVIPTVKFADLSGIRITSETRRTRRGGKSTSYYYICEKKSGGSVKVPVNNAVAQAAAPIILQEASARGIPVRDETAEQ
jgi:hypothetical protein